MKKCHSVDAVTCSNGECDAQSDSSQAIVVPNQFSLTAVVHHQGKVSVFLLLIFIRSELKSGELCLQSWQKRFQN